MKTTPETMRELYRLLDEYENEVREARKKGKLTSDHTVYTYLNPVNMFARWCDDNFIPGDKKRPK